MSLRKVVTGGQTGIDRAALDAAQAAGVPTGGWCPAGRRAEDGPIPARYPLRETPTRAYAQRTRWNVRDSDATLVLTPHAAPEGGTALTLAAARRRGKPCLHVRLPAPDAVARITAWAARHGVATLNVAGPRASDAPDLPAHARAVLRAAFRALRC